MNLSWLTPELCVVFTAFIVFAIGTGGVTYRKNAVAVLMSIELMINAAILLLVLGGRLHGEAQGFSAALLVLVLGAAEAVVGLALALALFRNRPTIDIDDAREVSG
jgi:NADH-quinone oxidoreductase subunit K